MRINIYLTTEN